MSAQPVVDWRDSPVDLTEDRARDLLSDIRTAISAAQDLLRLAWRQRIWIPLGHTSWDAFVTAELGDLRLKLPVDERRAEVGAWRAEGASVRAIAAALDVSTGTISSDLHGVKGISTADTPEGVGGADTLIGGEGEPQPHTPEGVRGGGHRAVVIGLDGRRRPGTRSASTPEGPQAVRTPRPVSLRVLDALAAAGADGLTLVEVSKRLRIRDGSSSGALSRLEAQGHCARTGDQRGERSVYWLASYLEGFGLPAFYESGS